MVISSRAASDRIWRTGTSGVAPLHSRGQPPGCGSCPLAAAMQNPLSAAVTMFAVPTFPAAKSRNKPPVYFFAKSIIPQFLQKINDCKKNIMISQQNRKRISDILLGNGVLRSLRLFHFALQKAFQIVPVNTPLATYFHCGNKVLGDHLADLLFLSSSAVRRSPPRSAAPSCPGPLILLAARILPVLMV